MTEPTSTDAAGNRLASDPCGPAPKRETLAALDHTQLVERFALGVENIDRRVFSLQDAQADMAFLPDAAVGRWSCRILIGHVADAELHFVQRMRHVLAVDKPVFWVWDEDAFVDSGIYGTESDPYSPPLAGGVAAVHTLRRWMLDVLRPLDRAKFNRIGMHPQRGEQTLRTILEYDVWHLEHHAWYLNKKVERMLGKAPEKSAAGCGPGCGCKPAANGVAGGE